MEFEFDVAKSESNKIKHGIDFVAAQALWDDPFVLEFPSKHEDENRFLVIGLIGLKHYTAIVTYRGETLRIISVRRSRREEVAVYESK